MRIIIFTLLFCSAQGKKCRDRRGQPGAWWCKVQPCHPAAVLWQGDSCEGPATALCKPCGPSASLSHPKVYPSSWSSLEKGFWMPGWHEEPTLILLAGHRPLSAARGSLRSLHLSTAQPDSPGRPPLLSSHPSPPDSSAQPLSHRPVIYVAWNSLPLEIEMTSNFTIFTLNLETCCPIS